MSEVISVRHEVELPVSAGTAWALVGAFHGLDRWHPSVVKTQNTGDSKEPGARRTLSLPDGASITEELGAFDDAQRRYRYRIVSGPLPVSDYEAELRVDEQDGKCRVVWESRFAPAGAGAEQAEEAIRGVYDAGLKTLEKLFSR